MQQDTETDNEYHSPDWCHSHPYYGGWCTHYHYVDPNLFKASKEEDEKWYDKGYYDYQKDTEYYTYDLNNPADWKRWMNTRDATANIRAQKNKADWHNNWHVTRKFDDNVDWEHKEPSDEEWKSWIGSQDADDNLKFLGTGSKTFQMSGDGDGENEFLYSQKPKNRKKKNMKKILKKVAKDDKEAKERTPAAK